MPFAWKLNVVYNIRARKKAKKHGGGIPASVINITVMMGIYLRSLLFNSENTRLDDAMKIYDRIFCTVESLCICGTTLCVRALKAAIKVARNMNHSITIIK